MSRRKEFDLFDNPQTIKFLWKLLYAVCGFLIILEMFVHRESHFGLDSFWGFYAILGFLACAVLILFSKVIGLILKVKENYYD